jgi:hypothetical protein
LLKPVEACRGRGTTRKRAAADERRLAGGAVRIIDWRARGIGGGRFTAKSVLILRERAELMEFVEAVRLVYHLANGMELAVDEETPRELQRFAQSQTEALDLMCESLRANNIG